MEWWLLLLLIFGGFFALMVAGMPVAFSFLTVNVIGAIFIWGGEQGLHVLINSVFTSISSFAFLPIPMFVLLGEVLFQSDIAIHAIDIVDKWFGRLPGRLSLVAVGAGTVIAALSGVSLGATALLASVLLPDMLRRGYRTSMSVGPCMCGGGLASIIPPSGFAVLIASLAEISMGKLLIAGAIPGLLLACIYAAYIIIRCKLQPSIAPPHTPDPIPLSIKLKETAIWVLPFLIIIFAVTGSIVLGLATPTEAAAVGALVAFILAACYKKLSWTLVKKSVMSTLPTTIMIMMILTGSTAFSQILNYTGTTTHLVELVVSAPLPPIGIVIIMMITLLIMGCFMEFISIVMITIPIFFPIVNALGFDPIWFGLLMLISVETGLLTPPFGMLIFVMKGLVPPSINLGQIIRSALPFSLCNMLLIALLIMFPSIGLWLPSFMRY